MAKLRLKLKSQARQVQSAVEAATHELLTRVSAEETAELRQARREASEAKAESADAVRRVRAADSARLAAEASAAQARTAQEEAVGQLAVWKEEQQ